MKLPLCSSNIVRQWALYRCLEMINANTNMQAASPAFETQRLFSLLGIGVDMLRSFAYIIIVIAGLSVFISMYNALKDRKYDLAIMRSLGASRGKLFVHVIIEGIIITTLGGLLGIVTWTWFNGVYWQILMRNQTKLA